MAQPLPRWGAPNAPIIRQEYLARLAGDADFVRGYKGSFAPPAGTKEGRLVPAGRAGTRKQLASKPMAAFQALGRVHGQARFTFAAAASCGNGIAWINLRIISS